MCSTRCTGCPDCEPVVHLCDRCETHVPAAEVRALALEAGDELVCGKCRLEQDAVAAERQGRALAHMLTVVQVVPANDVRPVPGFRCAAVDCEPCAAGEACPSWRYGTVPWSGHPLRARVQS